MRSSVTTDGADTDNETAALPPITTASKVDRGTVTTAETTPTAVLERMVRLNEYVNPAEGLNGASDSLSELCSAHWHASDG